MLSTWILFQRNIGKDEIVVGKNELLDLVSESYVRICRISFHIISRVPNQNVNYNLNLKTIKKLIELKVIYNLSVLNSETFKLNTML